jgi:hypothetical protein
MAKGKLNTPWNRFWLLVSLLWMGACWYGASTVNIPDGVDYNKLAQQARQSAADSQALAKKYADLGYRPATTAFDPDEFMAQRAKDAERVEAIHNREFLIALGTIGFVLWFLARFVRYGFAFGFQSTEPAPPPPAASTH